MQHGHGHGHGDESQSWLIDLGWRYDLGEWFLDRFRLRGAMRRLRERVLDEARLDGAEALLDIGCGTGTLLLAAARRPGVSLKAAGIDPAPRQIAWARAKARRRALPIDFREAGIEKLPFPDATFDRVTSTFMLHHLPPDVKRQGMAEVVRVLRPVGLIVVADLRHAPHDPDDKGWFDEVSDVLGTAGFAGLHTEEVPFPAFHQRFSGAVIVTGRRP